MRTHHHLRKFTALVFAVAATTLLAGTIAWTLAGAGGVRATARRFAFAPQLLLLGALNFDLLAVAFLCGAIVAARARRDAATAGLLALGTLSKLFPIVALPLLLLRASRPARVALVGMGIIAAGYVAAGLAGRTGATGPLWYLVGIDANMDSPWGLLALGLRAAGIEQGYGIVVLLSLVGLAATYVVAVLPRARAVDPAVPIGSAIVAVLLWSRLYSPQYSLWLLPLFVLLPLSGRLFALLTAGDVIVFATVYPLTLVRWAPDDVRAAALFAALVAGVVLRVVALAGIWRALRRPRPGNEEQ